MNKFKKWEYQAVIDIENNAKKYKDNPSSDFWNKYLQGRYISSPIIQETILTNPYSPEKALMTVMDVNPIRENSKLILKREDLTDKIIAYVLDICVKGGVAKWIENGDINPQVSDYVTSKCLEDTKEDLFLNPMMLEKWCIQFTSRCSIFEEYLKENGENEQINTAIYNNKNCAEYIRDMAYDKGIVIQDIKIPMTKKSEKSLIENSLDVLYNMPTNKETEKAQLDTVKMLSYLITNKLLSYDAQVLLYDAVNKDATSTGTFTGNRIICSLATHGTDISTLFNMYNNKFANIYLKDMIVYKNNSCPIKYRKEREEQICKQLEFYKKEKGYQSKYILEQEMYREKELIEYALQRPDDFPNLIKTLIDLDFKAQELELIKNKKIPMKYLFAMQNSNYPQVEISAMFMTYYIDNYVGQRGLDEFVKCLSDYISAKIDFTALKKEMNKIYESVQASANFEYFEKTLSAIILEYIDKHPNDKPHLYEMQDVLKVLRNIIHYNDLKRKHITSLTKTEAELVQDKLLKEFTNQKLINIYRSYDAYKQRYNELEKQMERCERECQDRKDQPQIETLGSR